MISPAAYAAGSPRLSGSLPMPKTPGEMIAAIKANLPPAGLASIKWDHTIIGAHAQ